MYTMSKMFQGNDNETSSTSTSGTEWQTTRSRRTAVPRGSAAYKPSATGYVPPSLRGAATEPVKPTSLSADDFPAFGVAPKPLAGAWGPKVSFAQKVNDLIAHEQRTEAEKENEREAAKGMDGWEVLSLCFDEERYRAYAAMFAVGARLERLVTDAALAKDVGISEKPLVRYSTDYDNMVDSNCDSDSNSDNDNE
jgi:hypothetical protein